MSVGARPSIYFMDTDYVLYLYFSSSFFNYYIYASLQSYSKIKNYLYFNHLVKIIIVNYIYN